MTTRYNIDINARANTAQATSRVKQLDQGVQGLSRGVRGTFAPFIGGAVFGGLFGSALLGLALSGSAAGDAMDRLQAIFADLLGRVLEPLIPRLYQLLDWFVALPESVQTAIAVIGLLVIGLGLLGSLFGGMGALILAAIGTGGLAAMGPVGWIIIGVIAALVLIIAIWCGWLEMLPTCVKIAIASFFPLGTAIIGLSWLLHNVLIPAWNAVTSWLTGEGDDALTTHNGALLAVGVHYQWLGRIILAAWNGIKQVTAATINYIIQNPFQWLISGIGWIQESLFGFGRGWVNTWNWLVTFLTSAVNRIKDTGVSVFSSFWSTAVGIFRTGANIVYNIIDAIGDYLSSIKISLPSFKVSWTTGRFGIPIPRISVVGSFGFSHNTGVFDRDYTQGPFSTAPSGGTAGPGGPGGGGGGGGVIFNFNGPVIGDEASLKEVLIRALQDPSVTARIGGAA